MKCFLRPVLCVFFVSLLLVSCGKKKTEVQWQRDSVYTNLLYQSAIALLHRGESGSAIEFLKLLEKDYPYTQEGTDALILLIWINYQDKEYTESELYIEDFIRYYPTHPYLPWVLYVQGMIQYAQMPNVRRTQADTVKALKIATDIQRRYGSTLYGKDFSFRQDIMLDHLAGQVMFIGRFYQKRRNYVGAINRFQEIMLLYPTTPQLPEAMYRLVESWLILGLDDEAFRILSVMGYNYPSNVWYKKAYALFQKNADLEAYANKYNTIKPATP